jgi:hypothetical protein
MNVIIIKLYCLYILHVPDTLSRFRQRHSVFLWMFFFYGTECNNEATRFYFESLLEYMERKKIILKDDQMYDVEA